MTIDCFKNIEKIYHSVVIQKLSATTYSKDCVYLKKLDTPSRNSIHFGTKNIWRARVGRGTDWIYYDTLLDAINDLKNHIKT